MRQSPRKEETKYNDADDEEDGGDPLSLRKKKLLNEERNKINLTEEGEEKKRR